MNLIFSFVVSFILIIFIVVLVFVSLQNYRIQKRMDEINSNEMKQTLGLKFTKETSASIIEFLNTLDVDEIKSLPGLITQNLDIAKSDHERQQIDLDKFEQDIILLRKNVSYSLNRLTLDFIDTYSESCNPNSEHSDLNTVEKDVLQRTFVFGLFSDIMNDIFDMAEITRTHKVRICELVQTLKTNFIENNNAITSLEKNILTNYGTNKNAPYTSLPTIPLYDFIKKNKHELYTILRDEDKRVFLFERYLPSLFEYIFVQGWADEIFPKINLMMLKFFNHHVEQVPPIYNETTTPFVFFNQFFLDYTESMGNERNELLDNIFNHINTEDTPVIQTNDNSVFSKLLYLYIPEMLIMSYYNVYIDSNDVVQQSYLEFIREFIFVDQTSIPNENYIMKRVIELFSKHIKDETNTMNVRFNLIHSYMNQPGQTDTKILHMTDLLTSLYPESKYRFDDLFGMIHN